MPGPPRWEELSPYLDRVLSLPKAERSAFVEGIRQEDPDMARLLLSYLEEHRVVERENFLQVDEPFLSAELERPGHHAGPYTLVSRIGQGGMGSVWLAERTDGEVELKVAIKFLRLTGRSDSWSARFFKERQLLASLNHTSIVHMIDAGRTQIGRSYLVMEYVDGVPIDVYCADRPVAERLTLFLRVCAGVSHAHRRLIIHRDLKPSNILVNASAEPKLLDFGIAKLLDPTGGDLTQTAERVLTPDYASPEQLRGLPQTTATDVYSLALVLYKMLTGLLPQHGQSKTATQAVADPGTYTIPRITSLYPHLPSDLDYVLRKALRSEPEERYRSVDAFADDIQAVLDSKPVRARSGNTAYLIRKFTRRHWIPMAALAMVVAALASGLYIANRERAIAQQRFGQVRELAHTFVFDLQDELAKLEGSTKVRELTVAKGLKYLDSLRSSGEDDPELQKEIAAAYLRIGDAQGFPTRPNLGRIDDALASYRKAGEIYKQLAARNDAYLPDLADYYLHYASLVRFTHDLTQARALSQAAIQTFENTRASGPQNADTEQRYVTAWCTVGDMDEDLGAFRLAWEEFSHCGQLARAFLQRANTRAAMESVAQADERVGTAAQELGQFEQAAQAFDHGQAVLDQLLQAEPYNPKLQRRRALVDLYRSELYFSHDTGNLGRPDLALKSARLYLARVQEMAAHDPNDTAAQFSRAVALFQMANCLRPSDPKSAVEMAQESVRSFDHLLASGKNTYLIASRRLRAMIRLGEAQLKADRSREALQTAETVLEAERVMAGSKSVEYNERLVLVSALCLAGEANAQSGRNGRAESLLQEARKEAQSIAKGMELQDAISLGTVDLALGRFYTRLQRTNEARGCFAESLSLWNRFPEANVYVAGQVSLAKQSLALLPH